MTKKRPFGEHEMLSHYPWKNSRMKGMKLKSSMNMMLNCLKDFNAQMCIMMPSALRTMASLALLMASD